MTSQPAEWSLQQRVTRVSAVILALLILIVGVMLGSLVGVQHRLDELTETWTPALLDSNAALSAMLDEESGVRGYELGREPTFLAPYTSALQPERTAEADLRTRLAGRPELLSQLDAFGRAVRAWQTQVARPAIAGVRTGDTTDSEGGAAAAKTAFDEVRHTSATLTASIVRGRTAAQEARTRAFDRLWIAVIAGAVVILSTAVLGALTLRRSVLTPIHGVVDQVREVAGGQLDHRISQRGPGEISGLARDVDAMRLRLVAELTRAERARQRLSRSNDELARSNADLEQFAYVASHDLSEPLRKVTNFCQLLERQYAGQLDERARTYMDFMVDGAKRMQLLINDLLAFSRVGRTNEGFRPVDLDLKLERALGNIEGQLQAAGAEVVADPLPTVPGDPTLLTALLQNLVSNAVKYRDPERPPRVRITSRQVDEHWEISVADNGIGIEPQYAERIFAIFQRLHLRDEYGGTGIGLALCRKIVDFHGGRIWLAGPDDDPAPDPAAGATFRFTVPLVQVAPDDDDPAPMVLASASR